MRLALWMGAFVVLGIAGGCTPSDQKPAATATPATSPPGSAAAAPPAASDTAEEAAEDEGDEILMVWAEAEPDEGAPPLSVQLKADISGGVGERKVKWEFGDGSPASSETNPTHTYDKAGTYRASVEVSDGSGDSDSDYVDIEVGTE
jgi:PKD repeat protein